MDFLVYTEGYGNLGEDAGEQAHQQEGKNDKQVAAMKNVLKKETCKAKFECLIKNAHVQQTITDMKTKNKKPNKKYEATSAIIETKLETNMFLQKVIAESGTNILLSEIKKSAILKSNDENS